MCVCVGVDLFVFFDVFIWVYVWQLIATVSFFFLRIVGKQRYTLSSSSGVCDVYYMCVYVCVCVCVRLGLGLVCMRVFMYVCMYDVSVCKYGSSVRTFRLIFEKLLQIYVMAFPHLCVCVYVFVCVYMYVCYCVVCE